MGRVSLVDLEYLKKTLRLAARGRGFTKSNPLVGAVLVKKGRVLATGFHHGFGRPHGEIDALRKAGPGQARGATLYVNLEPCNHFGKTPPCAKAIVEARIKRVVCCTQDPNPIVAGRGLRELKKNGIDVDLAVPLAGEAKKLNEFFFTFHKKRRPFIALKFAASLDGKIATASGDSKWITNESLRSYSRSLRGVYQAILVGVNTVIIDNPHLGARRQGAPDPLRIILDSDLRSPVKSQVFRDHNVLIAASQRAPRTRLTAFNKLGIRVVQFKGERPPLAALLGYLHKNNIVSVLVEGGSEVLGSFIDSSLADKVYAELAPIIVGGRGISAVGGRGADKISQALRLKGVVFKKFGDNLLLEGYA